MTEHVNQRSLTVGMTRHTHEYWMYYSREAVGSYDDLVGLGLRTRSKELASDFRQIDRARLNEPPGREITIRELRRELEGVANGRGYRHEQRVAAFDLLNKTQRLKPEERIVVGADIHRTLADAREIKERVRELSERSQERERSRGIGRGR